MKRIDGSARFPRGLSPASVALGNFDGVHLAHQRLIASARDAARAGGGISVVYTFDPHPARVLSPAECPPLLQTLPQRLHSIEALGVDWCVVEPFTAAFAALGPERFFREILVAKLGAASITVGYDFTFGLHRHGTAEVLKNLGAQHGVAVEILEAQFRGETLISSTNIRRTLAQGDVGEAAALLGRPYAIEGPVVSGRGVGREFGARTANVESVNELIPKDGVYLTRTALRGRSGTAEVFASITSIGDNPTFPHAPFAVETHLIDVERDVAGKTVVIEFLDRMRDQIAFDSPADLKEQIRQDIDAARKQHDARRMTHDA